MANTDLAFTNPNTHKPGKRLRERAHNLKPKVRQSVLHLRKYGGMMRPV